MRNMITRDDMAEYIKARLGHPVIDLELELAEKDGLGHVHLVIQDTLDWMFRNNQDEADYKDAFVLFLRTGIIEYILPEGITDVVDANVTFGNGFTPWTSFSVGPGESLTATTGWSQFDMVTYTGAMRYLSDVKKLVGQAYQVKYHPVERKLRIYPTPIQDDALILIIYRKEAISEIFDNILFRDLAVARLKILWGSILSKDDVQLPGGGKVNGDRILTQGEKERESAEKSILDQSARPFIQVG